MQHRSSSIIDPFHCTKKNKVSIEKSISKLLIHVLIILRYITADKFYIEPNGKSEVFVIDRISQETAVQGKVRSFICTSDIITKFLKIAQVN